ncbi:HdeD family acid-resistance protein [Escherichia coli]|uniref:HdeD family acid-resistance protein n=1 Tax=Escherichia coli TaxID=562 RepID=UPI0013D30DBD|nr:MFS transporter [Escherichia coli]EJE3976512.1 MFS transporter [Escherichia coli]ELL3262218.1 MFS transporter [Escherichia coli]MDI0643914.1 MFS transporter [Escherichia coli]MDI0941166.1 MFS transporter [Escherichia coli]MDI1221408.1 MFS transporter [Escherichia coli]
MIQILLLLFGAEFVRRKAKYLTFIGILWSVLGVGIFVDGVNGVTYFPLRTFGALLLLESLVTLSIASGGVGAQKAVLYFKGGIFCFVAILILSDKPYSNLLLSIIFGLAFFVIGLFVIVSAWVVRYPMWKRTILGGIAQMLFAIFIFSFPGHNATIPVFLGTLMLISGLNTIRLALRTGMVYEGEAIFDLLAPTDILNDLKKWSVSSLVNHSAFGPDINGPLTVHIWTPVGTANSSPIPRPIINRYIAAVDTDGVISTGHAALELLPDIYISFYPAIDIDRSPSEFLKTLKATKDNNVPGIFQPDYVTEAADWCESDRKIFFHKYNRIALQRYWQRYQMNTTYNLTYRNCSSSVAYALEASLDGVLSEQSKNPRSIMRTLFMPELWIAAQVRKRAQSMAWTPGLVMDYARALRSIVHPVPESWYQRFTDKYLRQ